jgi:hypothetical protein
MAFETHGVNEPIMRVAEPPQTRFFRTYKAHLVIFGESSDGPWEKIVSVEIEGPADIAVQVISWAADAFKEHEER